MSHRSLYTSKESKKCLGADKHPMQVSQEQKIGVSLPHINKNSYQNTSNLEKQLKRQIIMRQRSKQSLMERHRTTSMSKLLVMQLIPRKLYNEPDRSNVTGPTQSTKKLPPISTSNKTPDSSFKISKDSTHNAAKHLNQTLPKPEKYQHQNNSHNEQPIQNSQSFQENNQKYQTKYFTMDHVIGNTQGWVIKKGQYHIGQYVFNTDQKNQENLLGVGGFGKVFKGFSVNKNHPEVAIKVMNIDKEQKLKMCQLEILRQRLVKSQGIVKIFMSKVIPINQKQNIFVVACQLMDGQLKVPDQGYPLDEALFLLKQILKCYRQLYKRKMTHRDLKPANILTLTKEDKNIIKISDFGAAIELTQKRKTNPLTKAYASPQQYRNQEYTDKCDVYAIGCIFFQLLVGKTPSQAKCTVKQNIMNFDKIRKILEQKEVPLQMIQFIEGCLREKERVEMEKDGRKVEDPKKSRFSWEEVYLHSLFRGEFNHIPRQVSGSSILLTIKTNAKSNEVDVIDLLRQHQKEISNEMKKEYFIQLLKDNKINIPREDIDLLDRMFGGSNTFIISQLLDAFSKLDEKQYSNYSPKDASAFWEMFHLKDGKGDGLLFAEKLKNGKYKQQSEMQLEKVNFTAFPLFPPMDNLKEITIQFSQIQVLEARLNASKLQKLSINECQVERIITIRGCPNLTQLNLIGNRLRQIEGIQMLPRLEVINFGGNRLQRISGIDHLKYLATLWLLGNRISNIEGLSGCTSLYQLALQHNKINALSEHLIEMAKTKAPLKKIHLYMNQIGGTQKNKQILRQFKILHPDSVVFLSGDFYSPQQIFSQAIQYARFAQGYYRITCAGNPTKRIGIGQFSTGQRATWLSPTDEEDYGQIWYIKQQEDNIHCIFPYSRKEIVSVNWGFGQLRPYDEEEDHWEEDITCRLIFIKEDEYNERFSIKVAALPLRFYWTNAGGVKVYMKKKYQQEMAEGILSDGCHLWKIDPFEIKS